MVRARKGLAALRRLKYDEDHPLVLAAAREVQHLEQEERRTRPPEDVLRSAQDRLALKSKEKLDTDTLLAEAEERVATLRQKASALSEDVESLQREVLEARQKVTMSTAGLQGMDLAGVATNLLNLQALIGNAETSVSSGQGLQLLQSIHAEIQAMGVAFPASRAAALAASAAATGSLPSGGPAVATAGPAASGPTGGPAPAAGALAPEAASRPDVAMAGAAPVVLNSFRPSPGVPGGGNGAADAVSPGPPQPMLAQLG